MLNMLYLVTHINYMLVSFLLSYSLQKQLIASSY